MFRMQKQQTVKLVDSKAVPAHLQEAHEQNAKQSPLIRLPPELRNHIWEYVLLGRVIHVEINSSRVDDRARFCVWIEHETSYTYQALLAGTPNRPSVSAATHGACFSTSSNTRSSNRPNKQRNLSLLQVCRQTHSDAALLPFSGNTFVFHPRYWMVNIADTVATFLLTLVREQARAIASIVLEVIYDVEPARYNESRAILVHNLTGLWRLVYRIEIAAGNWARMFIHHEGIRMEHASTVFAFEGLARDFKVDATNGLVTRRGAEVVSDELLRSWSEDLQRRMTDKERFVFTKTRYQIWRHRKYSSCSWD